MSGRFEPYEVLYNKLVARLRAAGTSDLHDGTLVVVPSLSFPPVELRKIRGITRYEERMLFLLLLLARPRLRVVYATSLPIDPAIVDYYLRFVPDAAGARSRLVLVDCGDPEARPLAAKLVASPAAVERLRSASLDPRGGYMVTFNVTEDECALSEVLGVPLYGARLDLVALGSKSGSRRVARRAGVPVFDGAEDVRSAADVHDAIAALRTRRPGVSAVVVKLNNGFSGQGNAIVRLERDSVELGASDTAFCAVGESWATFGPKIEAEGAIVEELLREPGMRSPSVQVRIEATGRAEVLSTHDQILGPPDDQVYLGCRFPARADYRGAICDHAVRVGRVLAAEGVIGSFGIDFIVVPGPEVRVYLSEINLRLGGTTHPYWMARLATGARYDGESGELVAAAGPISYVASDNLGSVDHAGLSPAAVIDAVASEGIGYPSTGGAGAMLHLLGALPEYGKFGATCIAGSLERADDLFVKVSATVARLKGKPP